MKAAIWEGLFEGDRVRILDDGGIESMVGEDWMVTVRDFSGLAVQLARTLEGGETTLEAAEEGVRNLLHIIGATPGSPGIQETPSRVVRALREMTAGYYESPGEILSKRFDGGAYDEMIVVTGIRFTSLCEHHMLPFQGEAVVGYLPGGGGVVGLSKIPRLVLCFARRLQLQERLTQEIATAMMDHLMPLGVGVVIRARHECMSCRGVRAEGAEMITSALLGAMRGEGRAEFLGFTHGR